MVFSSIIFIYAFLPMMVLLYALAPKKLKNTVLLIGSLIFYAWGERLLVILFALTIIIGWVSGQIIEKNKGNIYSKVCLVITIFFCLGILCYFKYANFFVGTFNHLTGLSIKLLSISLPIGISFYIFQIIGYVVDVYKNQVYAEKNIINFGTYVSFFPQLIAGPIVRYKDIKDQLRYRTHTIDKISSGIRRFTVGLGKKVLLANVLGEVCNIYTQTPDKTIIFAWFNVLCFCLQLYFDFSGYSDMAVGLGRIFGFELPDNFNYPFIASSITDFWKRWHITLSRFFRDYVYIPLGGNKKGIKKQCINILIVWMLTGLWHGAAMNFVLWGILFALLLILEKLVLLKFINKHKIIGHFYVVIALLISFSLFNAESAGGGLSNIRELFGVSNGMISSMALYYIESYILVVITSIILATPLSKYIYNRLLNYKALRNVLIILEPIAVALIILTSTAFLVDGSFNPFLYFRF